MSKNVPLIVSGIIFAIFALVHLVRLFTGFSVAVGGKSIPMGVSVAGLIIGGLLSIWMFVSAK
jgi:hypothetical protein